VNAKPKRRWYQFSVLTLLMFITAVAAVVGSAQAWRSHRRFCIERTTYHGEMHSKAMVGSLSFPNFELSVDEQIERQEAESAYLKEKRRYHLRLNNAYYDAIWRPWERIWIDESSPPESPISADEDRRAREYYKSMMEAKGYEFITEPNGNEVMRRRPKSSALAPNPSKP
jgi:hypothetical protein